MAPDDLFQIANPLALLGWLLLLGYPFAPRVIGIASGLVLPLILSLGYAGLILVYWAGAEGGFDSLANVMLLFDTPGAALAGWVHFLAFDLFIGAWEARDARRHGIPHLAVIPCMALTFMFGPIGLLLYITLRWIWTMRSPSQEVSS